MTWEEFNEWFVHHASGFTGLHSWLGKFPESQADAKADMQPTQERILQRWFRVLESVELRDAKRASDSLHAGEEDEPKGFDKHPGAVRSIAQKFRDRRGDRGRHRGPRVVGGRELVDCLACEDWGRVSCWRPEAMQQAAAGELTPPYYTCALACTCEAGAAYRHTHRTFNPKLDLPLRRQDGDGQWRLHLRDDPAEHEALRELVHSIRETRRQEAVAADPQGRIPF